jgi:hypothetical protein
MATRRPPLSRDQLLETIRSVADKLQLDRLPQELFLQRAGLSRWAVDRHFDKWADACRAAGIGHGRTLIELPKKQRHTEEDCLAEMRRVAALRGTTTLSSKVYADYGRIGVKAITNRFGDWRRALAAAGLAPTAASERQRLPSREQCVSELTRVANALRRPHLTSAEYDKHGHLSSYRITRVFGTWHAALQEAGLVPSPRFIREVPLSVLADDFLRASIDLGRVPTINQLTRRSKHASHTFSGKHGGYQTFKERAITHLFSTPARIPPAIKRHFEAELARLLPGVSPSSEGSPAAPHRRGRTLNFRAFLYAPTSEHDVVQLFGSVADELGFEIVGNRSAFPDCEARRTRPGSRETLVRCLIEYEFASSDYRRHKHPSTGCDLVVCWQHDWPECPIEVLELQTAIRKLDGWR